MEIKESILEEHTRYREERDNTKELQEGNLELSTFKGRQRKGDERRRRRKARRRER